MHWSTFSLRRLLTICLMLRSMDERTQLMVRQCTIYVLRYPHRNPLLSLQSSYSHPLLVIVINIFIISPSLFPGVSECIIMGIPMTIGTGMFSLLNKYPFVLHSIIR